MLADKGPADREAELPGEAVRDARQLAKPTEKRQHQANLEDIRQWQRHYRKVFPQIVFYFDNVPEETRERIKRQVKNLGSVSVVLLPA